MKSSVKLFWYISEALISLIILTGTFLFFKYYTIMLPKWFQTTLASLALSAAVYFLWINPLSSRAFELFIEHINDNLLLWIVTQFTLLLIIKNIFDLLPNMLYKAVVVFGILGFVYENHFTPFRRYEDILIRCRRYLFFRNASSAITVLKEGLEVKNLSSAERADLMLHLGELHLRKKDASGCRYYFSRAITLDSLSKLQLATFYFKIGMVYFKYKDYKKSGFFLEKTLDLIVNDLNEKISPEFLIDLTKSLVYTNQKQRAVEIYNTLYKKRLCKRSNKIEHLLGLK